MCLLIWTDVLGEPYGPWASRFLIYGLPVGIQILALLWKSQCRVSDTCTQVTVKALGLFFIFVAVRVLDNFEFILYIGNQVVFQIIKNSVRIDFWFFLVRIEDLHG